MAQEKILIVDDDPDITEAMKLVLEEKGYSVDQCGDRNQKEYSANIARSAEEI